MRKCIIIGGADISDYHRIREYISKNDFCIYCDSGLKHEQKLRKHPDLVVGDFDSYTGPVPRETETIILPREKDDTDTMYGTKEGIKRGFNEFVLIGVSGNRMDHTLANISILSYLNSVKKKALLVDDYSEMEIISDNPAEIPDSFSFFSVLNIYGTAEGINIENAKYPLSNAEISTDYQYGISNEVIPGKKAVISIKKGKLLLIKVF